MTHLVNADIVKMNSGLICHQVNCRKVAGAGVALQIRRKYPEWYKEFQERPAKLGQIGIHIVDGDLSILDMYSQDGFGRDKQFTDYNALRECFQKVRHYAGGRTVYIPYRIGCGLGGGNWEEVSAIIEQEIPEAYLVRNTR